MINIFKELNFRD